MNYRLLPDSGHRISANFKALYSCFLILLNSKHWRSYEMMALSQKKNFRSKRQRFSQGNETNRKTVGMLPVFSHMTGGVLVVSLTHISTPRLVERMLQAGISGDWIMKRLALITVLIFLSSPASSKTGNDLIEAFDKCGKLNETNVTTKQSCAFITGYFHAAYESQTIWRMSCMPEGVTYTQMAKVTEKWLREHPEELHNTQRFLVNKAFEDAWPCPEK
jgi:hypothetical protein